MSNILYIMPISFNQIFVVSCSKNSQVLQQALTSSSAMFLQLFQQHLDLLFRAPNPLAEILDKTVNSTKTFE